MNNVEKIQKYLRLRLEAEALGDLPKKVTWDELVEIAGATGLRVEASLWRADRSWRGEVSTEQVGDFWVESDTVPVGTRLNRDQIQGGDFDIDEEDLPLALFSDGWLVALEDGTVEIRDPAAALIA